MPSTLEAAATQNERWERGRSRARAALRPPAAPARRRAVGTRPASPRSTRPSTTSSRRCRCSLAAVGAVSVGRARDVAGRAPASAPARGAAAGDRRCPRRRPDSCSPACRCRWSARCCMLRGWSCGRCACGRECWAAEKGCRGSARHGREERPSRNRSTAVVLGVPVDDVTVEEAVDDRRRVIEASRASGTRPPGRDGQRRLRRQRAARPGAARDPAAHVPRHPRRHAASCGASRMFGTPLRQRTTGVDLLPALVERAAQRGHRVVLFGAAPGVAARAADELSERYPGARGRRASRPGR